MLLISFLLIILYLFFKCLKRYISKKHTCLRKGLPSAVIYCVCQHSLNLNSTIKLWWKSSLKVSSTFFFTTILSNVFSGTYYRGNTNCIQGNKKRSMSLVVYLLNSVSSPNGRQWWLNYHFYTFRSILWPWGAITEYLNETVVLYNNIHLTMEKFSTLEGKMP